MYALACAMGYYSHFVLKFPQDWRQLAAILSAYLVLSVLVYLIERYREREAFFISSSHRVSYGAAVTS